jgi:hypothetical protein
VYYKIEKVDMNKNLISVLMCGLGLSNEEIYFHDIDDLIGTLVDDPEFDKVVAEMDKIDKDIWL